MATDERDVVTVFGLKLEDTYGVGRWSCEVAPDLELTRVLARDGSGREIVALWANGGGQFAVGSGDTIEDAQADLVERARVNLAACQRFLEMFGGDHE